MNTLAYTDAVLASVCLGFAFTLPKRVPAIRFGLALIGSAAFFGVLRFSELLPLPPLHQFLSMASANAGLPLLAIAVAWPKSPVSSQAHFTWLFVVSAIAVGLLMTVAAGFKAWADICAAFTVLLLLTHSVRRKEWLALAATLCLIATLLVFLSRFTAFGLQEADFLHIGLALFTGLLAIWSKSAATQGSKG